jgi:methylaspartate mutase S subunit
MAKQITLITGTVGQDSHVIGIKLLSRALREAGFKTIELGGLTPAEEFIQAAQESAAEAIMISSLYGMAEMDLEGFKDKCVEAGLGHVLLYLGGNLAVGRHDFKDDETKFKAMGFNRVYPPEVDFAIVIADLKSDLKAKGKT